MQFQLSEEHLMIQKAARDFAMTECLPGVIERDELHIRDMSQEPDDTVPCFSVKAEYFSLYSIDQVDWDKVNIVEIVKQIEKMEDEPEY